MDLFRQENSCPKCGELSKEGKGHAGKIESGLRAVQREWYDLAFNYPLKISDFQEPDPVWEAFK